MSSLPTHPDSAPFERMSTLEQLLVETRLLTTAQLDTAQRDANVRHKRLAAAIIDLGLIDERRFAEWLAKVTELPIVDPLPSGAIAQLQHRISPQLAREYQVVPLAIERDSLTVATLNPLDQSALEIIRHATGLHIRAVISMYGALSDALDRFYPEQDHDLTLMHRPPDLSRSTIAAPMAIGSETVLAGVGRPFAKQSAEPPPSGDEQLDRIERSLSDLVNAVEKLQRRVDAMDATIARVLSRK